MAPEAVSKPPTSSPIKPILAGAFIEFFAYEMPAPKKIVSFFKARPLRPTFEPMLVRPKNYLEPPKADQEPVCDVVQDQQVVATTEDSKRKRLKKKRPRNVRARRTNHGETDSSAKDTTTETDSTDASDVPKRPRLPAVGGRSASIASLLAPKKPNTAAGLSKFLPPFNEKWKNCRGTHFSKFLFFFRRIHLKLISLID